MRVCLQSQVSSMQCACITLSSVACVALNILPHYLTNNIIKKKKKLTDINCVLIFSTIPVCNIPHSTKNLVRYDQKCTLVFM